MAVKCVGWRPKAGQGAGRSSVAWLLQGGGRGRGLGVVLGLGLVAACTEPNPRICAEDCDGVDGDDDELGDGTGADDLGPDTSSVGDGDGDGDGDGGDGDGDGMPRVGRVLVDGETAPLPVDRARIVTLRVEASAPAGVTSVAFRSGENLVGEANSVGDGAWEYRWPVNGEELDGAYELRAVMQDEDGALLDGEATSVEVDLPPMGSEVWSWSGAAAPQERVASLLVDDAGDRLVVFVSPESVNGGKPTMRTFSLGGDDLGLAPQFEYADISQLGGRIGGASITPSGDEIAVSGQTFRTPFGPEYTALTRAYQGDGAFAWSWVPSSLDPSWIAEGIDVVHGPEDHIYVALQTGGLAREGRLVRLEPDGSYRGAAVLLAAPAALTRMDDALWALGRVEASASPRLEGFTSELDPIDSFEGVFGSTDLAADPESERLFVVGKEVSAVGRISAYAAADGASLWSIPFGPGDGAGTATDPAAVVVDDHGRVVVAGAVGPDVYLQRLDAEGTVRQQTVVPGLPDPTTITALAVDEVGYIYLGGVHDDGSDRELVVTKLHP